MKRKTSRTTTKEDEVQKSDVVKEPQPKPATKPLNTEAYLKFIKCVYNSPVNVTNAPSGKAYSFQPGQTLPVRSLEDYHYLMSLKRNPGPNCCGGAEQQARTYFDVVEMEA